MKYSSLIIATSLLTMTAGCASNKDSQATTLELKHVPETTVNADKGKELELNEFHPAEDILYAEESVALPSTAKYAVPQKQKISEGKDAEFASRSRLEHAAKAFSVDMIPSYYQDEGREKYAAIEHSEVKLVSTSPVSTFSIDVDTASYANIRRFLTKGALPPADAVRVEEMVNYFSYSYDAPSEPAQPFSINTELAKSPWSADHVLLKVGLKGYEAPIKERPSSNLVFLLDVSGSMNAPDKLPLLKKSLVLLSKQLSENDSVAIVVYAGASGVVLEPTKGNETHKIESALNQLSAGGSTNGQAGIQLAYELAKQNYDEQGINRVILATDGDFNVGTSDVESLKKLIERKREEGVSLTTLGFGTGNYNDQLMETLADHGNGNYAYIDTFSEAKKVLAEQLNATLMTIAKDVKIQLEFNPGIVKEYRLLGYENQALKREDFNNDRVDAGEIGAGHTVTAIYELALQSNAYSSVDPLRYQTEAQTQQQTVSDFGNELAFVKFRYKAPNGDKSKLISQPIKAANFNALPSFDQASESFRFAASVAQFGEALRHSKYVQNDYEAIISNALKARGEDPMGYRSEFIQLVRLAAKLSNT
jgi:Ca-activated chloride channel homolog